MVVQFQMQFFRTKQGGFYSIVLLELFDCSNRVLHDCFIGVICNIYYE